MAVPAHVLVFDSGVGALSIIQEIRQLIPNCSITYASDNAFFPYGNKEEDLLISRVDDVLKKLGAVYTPDIIVVACNSASTVALPKIRDHFTIPTVGVVPAIRPAAQQSQSRVIGLLATPGTVKRRYTLELIQEFAPDCEVISIGSSELVQQAERKIQGLELDAAVVNAVIDELFNSPRGEEIDTVVLACTHFPLLKNELMASAPKSVTWVDSGNAIARRVNYWIEQKQLSLIGDAKYRSVFTGTPFQSESFKSALANFLPGPIETITV